MIAVIRRGAHKIAVYKDEQGRAGVAASASSDTYLSPEPPS